MFFTAKIFPILSQKNSSLSLSGTTLHEQEFAMSLIDYSTDIIMENLNNEKMQMTYMNSTVSHEMRNPLNSIHSQIVLIEGYLQEMERLFKKHMGTFSAEDQVLVEDLVDDLSLSIKICKSSCRLLSFSVEDILALPQLKEGKFRKNLKVSDLKKAVEEVMAI